MRHIATVVTTMPPPEQGPRTTELVEPRLLDALQQLLARLGVPPEIQIAIATTHTNDECPCNGGKSGEFCGCTCEFLEINLGAMSPDDLKVAIALGNVQKTHMPIDPTEAN